MSQHDETGNNEPIIGHKDLNIEDVMKNALDAVSRENGSMMTTLADNEVVKQYAIFITIPIARSGDMETEIDRLLEGVANAEGGYVARARVHVSDLKDTWKDIGVD